MARLSPGSKGTRPETFQFFYRNYTTCFGNSHIYLRHFISFSPSGVLQAKRHCYFISTIFYFQITVFKRRVAQSVTKRIKDVALEILVSTSLCDIIVIERRQLIQRFVISQRPNVRQDYNHRTARRQQPFRPARPDTRHSRWQEYVRPSS